MITYLLKRLLAMVPTLIGITLITFLIVNFAPGDPVETSMGARGGSEGGSEGGGDQDQLADSIKAKKRLLGMMKEDRTLLAYAASGAAPPEEGEVVASLEQVTLGELTHWAHAIASAPGGNLVVGGDQGLLVLVDAEGNTIRTYAGHEDSVWALAVNATTLVSASSDGTIRVHDVAKPEPTAQIPGTGRPVRELALLPGGTSFLAISDDGWIKRFSVTGQEEQRYEGHNSGTTALELVGDGSTFWSGGRDRMLRRWELASGAALAVVEGHESVINDIELRADGTQLATACDDRQVRAFPVAPDGTLGEPVLLAGHHKAATAVAWVGDRLFSGSRDESVREWDPASGHQTAQVPVSIGRVHDLRVSADGKAVVVAADAWSVVPVPVRYLKWLARVLTLDFDRSFVDNEPVIGKIARALPVTLGLNLTAILLIYTISVPIGIYAAVNRGGWFDTGSSVIVFMLYSMPSFWVATLLIMGFSSVRTLNWFPSVGLHDAGWQDFTGLQVIGDVLMHLVLPITASVYTGFATLSRYVRTSMLEVIEQDYIRTARAKGLHERVVVLKHAFRNALVVIVTLLGNLLPAMIGGSVIIEYIFSIQGMGLLGFNAILSRDYPTIMAITTMSAGLTLIGILVSDLLYGVADPRVRVEK